MYDSKYQFPMLILQGLRLYCSRMQSVFASLKSRLLFWVWGIESGEGSKFEGKVILSTRRRGQIVLGKNVIFNSRISGNLAGMSHPTIIDCHAQGAKLTIGDNAGFSSVAINCRTSITIGRNVKVGADVRIYDHDFHSIESDYRKSCADAMHIRKKPIVIGDDCFIGAQSIILKGTRLANETIVAAGSVVFGLDVPPKSLVKGNPAVIVYSLNG